MAIPMCLSHIAIATGEMGGFSETSKFVVIKCTKVTDTYVDQRPVKSILYGYRNDNFKRH